MKKGFSKDFYLVVIGQIISLFGNAVIRFALPLHLLSVTGSAALLGVVSGVAFLPLVVMSPIGGLIADRMNKRNIMVVLDFFTAGLVLLFLVLSGRGSLVSLILIMLFLLYGISGAYQPSVQASIPLLVSEEAVMPANAIINMVSSLPACWGLPWAALLTVSGASPPYFMSAWAVFSCLRSWKFLSIFRSLKGCARIRCFMKLSQI